MSFEKESKEITLQLGSRVSKWLAEVDPNAKFVLLVLRKAPKGGGYAQALTASPGDPVAVGSILQSAGEDLINQRGVTIEYPEEPGNN